MEKIEDHQLLRLMSQDNEKALDELFARYFWRLCRFTARITLSNPVSEEIVSDVFVSIWIRRKHLKISASIDAYLFTAVRNKAVGWVSKHRDNITLDGIDPSSQVGTDAEMLFENMQTEVARLLQKLPDQQKLVIELNRIEGYSPREVAGLLNISPKTVYNHLREANLFLSKHREVIYT